MAEIRGLNAWMRTLADKELPTLSSVVKDICELSENVDCRADDLTRIILRDANLTSRVLKVANSVHYNRAFMPIKTVSRCIVQLGFNNLKNITLTTSLIDSFLKGKPKKLLVQCLARSFHAAVQAKALVPYLGNENKEQVFIAALLRNIGELALLASGKETAEKFVTARDVDPDHEHSISQEYLGVDINQINRALIKEWSLGELVREASENHGHANVMVHAVNLGNEISRQIYTGLNSPEMIKLYAEVAQLCNISIDAAKQQVIAMAEEASVIAKSYCAEALLPALPNIQDLAIHEEKKTSQSGYEFQQHINKIHQILFAGGELSTIMQCAVAALHDGSGFARATIAMVDYKTKCLDVRYIAGRGTHIWRQNVHIELDKLQKNELLHEFLRVQQHIWYQPALAEKPLGALTALSEQGDIMMSPLKIDKRLIAVLYADNDGKTLNQHQFENFQLMANQLNLILRVNSK